MMPDRLTSPTVGQNNDGRLEVFAFGVNDAVWHIWQDPAALNGWSNWDNLGGEPGGAGLRAVRPLLPDDATRDFRLTPVLQLGVSYSF